MRTAIGLCILLLGPAFAQQTWKYIKSGQYYVKGQKDEVSIASNQPISMGRSFIMVFKQDGCAADEDCTNKAIAQADKLGCEGYTIYKELNMIGSVCFPPATIMSNSRQAIVQTLTDLLNIQDFGHVSLDAKVQLKLPKETSTSAFKFINKKPLITKKTPAPTTSNKFSGDGSNLLVDPSTFPAVYNWGLDRSDQQSAYLDYDESQCPNGGENVQLWLLDTGCRITHVEYTGRATTESVNMEGTLPYGDGADGHGHGSHTAGIAAGVNVGVAPKATIRCIKVLGDDGSGSIANVIAGMNMALQYKTANPDVQMLASMSLGALKNDLVNKAVDSLYAANILSVVAAGNSNADAGAYSPSSAANAITVGATQKTDNKDSYSNYGSVVDMYAPGGNINSCAITSDTSYQVLSGTSMAAPVVAGAFACVMSNSQGKVCTADVLLSQVTNPRVTVSQPKFNAARPFVYMPPTYAGSC